MVLAVRDFWLYHNILPDRVPAVPQRPPAA